MNDMSLRECGLGPGVSQSDGDMRACALFFGYQYL
jgi:hypothetical protein